MIFNYSYRQKLFQIHIIADYSSLLEIKIFYNQNQIVPEDINSFAMQKCKPIVACHKFFDKYFQNYYMVNKKKYSLLKILDPERNYYVLEDFDLVIRLNNFTILEKEVFCKLMNIEYSSTISYSKLADICNISGGARFVGNTMAKNKFPIIIPCHRVIHSNGSIGNYSGGKEIKQALLGIEGFV
jgi:O-6-methylguanine DNA methyltransferase